MEQPPPSSHAPRPRKQDRLPLIIKLSREGLSTREIGEQVGVPKSTVGKWLRAARSRRAAKKNLDPAEIIRRKIARYQSISAQLLEAWRLSQADKQVRVVEHTGPAGDPAAAKEKNSLRTETQTGNAAYLAKAMDAENRIEVLEQRLAALLQTGAARTSSGPALLAKLSDEDLENLTSDELDNFSDDELYIIGARLHAKYGRTDHLLTNEELRNMNDEQLTALEQQLLEEIERESKAE
jgi:hypothetical protein